MANVDLYQNKLRGLLEDPSSFQKTPGFQFALETGSDAINRSNSRMRGSGNALAALTQYGTGLASQEYGAQLDRLGKLTGQEQQYDLGQVRNANDLTMAHINATNTANNNIMGHEAAMGANAVAATSAANAAQRNRWDYELGSAQNANAATRNANDYSLGSARTAADYSLGSQQNANTAQRNWWDHQSNTQQNNNTAANNQNNFNLGMYGAQTQRGSARSNDYFNGQNNQREWWKLNPPTRYV